MRKPLVCFFLMIFLAALAGCSAGDKASQKSSPVVSGQAAPARSDTDQDKAATSQTPDLNQYLTSHDSAGLVGIINVGNDRFNIHMTLNRVNEKLSGLDTPEYNSSLLITSGKEAARFRGNYYYDRAKTAMRVEALLYQSGYLGIVEYDREGNFNGSFGGFIAGSGITGIWHDKDGGSACPFQLWLDNSKRPVSTVKQLNLKQLGEYKRRGNDELYGAYLNISSAVDEGFCFRIEGYWKDHNGMVDGVAFFSDDSHTRAAFVNPSDGLKMDFVFKDSTVEVSANDVIANYAGVNVSLTGSFEKSAQK